ncbi:MAG: 50S ribosomal protein L9 [Deltaproteobacteria bacterium]|nr:50S ribosomal protein L9 [Deltaproteobacteria bacterium]
MRIILTQDVSNLGSLGDEVQVKNGYARNFLLPRGMAITSSGENARSLAHRRKHLDSIRSQAVGRARTESEKLAALDLVVKVKAGAGGKLFGTVTNRDLHALLAQNGFELDRKSIHLNAPVRSLGNFMATVKLHTEVKVEVPFRVEPEGELVVAAPEDAEGEVPTAESAPKETPAEGDSAKTPSA